MSSPHFKISCSNGQEIIVAPSILEKCAFLQSYHAEWKENLKVDYSSYTVCELCDAILAGNETAIVSERLYPLADYFGYINLRTALISERDRQITASIIGFLERPTTPSHFEHLYFVRPYERKIYREIHREPRTYRISIQSVTWRAVYAKIGMIPYNRQGILNYFNIPYIFKSVPGMSNLVPHLVPTETVTVSETGVIVIDFRVDHIE